MAVSDKDECVSPGLLYSFISELLVYRVMKMRDLYCNFSRIVLYLNIILEPIYSLLQKNWYLEVFLASICSIYSLVEAYSCIS